MIASSVRVYGRIGVERDSPCHRFLRFCGALCAPGPCRRFPGSRLSRVLPLSFPVTVRFGVPGGPLELFSPGRLWIPRLGTLLFVVGLVLAGLEHAFQPAQFLYTRPINASLKRDARIVQPRIKGCGLLFDSAISNKFFIRRRCRVVRIVARFCSLRLSRTLLERFFDPQNGSAQLLKASSPQPSAVMSSSGKQAPGSPVPTLAKNTTATPGSKRKATTQLKPELPREANASLGKTNDHPHRGPAPCSPRTWT